jgi:hypothetical protein
MIEKIQNERRQFVQQFQWGGLPDRFQKVIE